jgi:hypothetical protein
MSSEVETSLAAHLLKVRDPSTTLGMTKKRSRHIGLLCSDGFASPGQTPTSSRSGVRHGRPTICYCLVIPSETPVRLGPRDAAAQRKAKMLAMIKVHRVSGDEYEVKVGGATQTTHRVTLRDADRQRLGGKDISAERLVEESFRFLLEREPNTSILSSFELPLIGKYFPQYAREIRKRLRQG